MDYGELFRALRQRKLVQTILLYLGASWGILQAVSLFQSTYSWPRTVFDATLFLLGCGLAAAATIAWFHGERGHQRVTRLELAILSLVGLVAIAGGWGLALRQPLAQDADAAAAPERTVAVLPFVNTTRDSTLAWLQKGLAEMLATDLAQVPALRVVSGERVFDLLRQAGSAEAAIVPEPVALKVARSARAGYLVRGAVFREGDNTRLDAQLVRISDGTVAGSAQAVGPDIFPLVDTLASRLAARLTQSAGQEAHPAAPLADVATDNLQAYREYQLGLEADRRLLHRDALVHYRRAVELDSTFAQALMRLARVEMTTGSGSASMRHLLAAQRNLTYASEHDRLYVEGVIAMWRRDLNVAAAKLEALTRRYPDDKDGWLALAELYNADPARRGRREALLRRVTKLDPFYAPAYNDLAYALAQRGDFAGADSFALRYVQLEPNQPNPLDTRGEIQEMMGRYAQARVSYLAALALRPDFIDAMTHLVRCELRARRLDELRADLAPFTRSATPLVRVSALSSTAESYTWQGRPDDALRLYQQAYDASGADAQLRLASLNRQANIWMLLGDYARVVQSLRPFVREPDALMFRYLAALGELRRFDDMRAVRQMVARFAARPGVAAFAAGAPALVDAYIAYYEGDFAATVNAFRASKRADRLSPELRVDGREVLALVQSGRAAEALPLIAEPADPRALTPPPLLYLRGRVYEALGRRAEAAAAYRGVLAVWGAAVQRFPQYRDIPQRLARLGA